MPGSDVTILANLPQQKMAFWCWNLIFFHSKMFQKIKLWNIVLFVDLFEKFFFLLPPDWNFSTVASLAWWAPHFDSAWIDFNLSLSSVHTSQLRGAVFEVRFYTLTLPQHTFFNHNAKREACDFLWELIVLSRKKTHAKKRTTKEHV